ncbi:MAG TPA: HNH endonuclease [Candidatus Dojkabacteria bacterium]|nr:HNH endonuclease [Candidatus Dojkabacteria bacterium]
MNDYKQKVHDRDLVCQKCGTSGSKDNPLTVHHIIYKCKGGTNSLENCVLLCRNCHRELHKNNPTRVVRKPRKHRRK